jgi:hypothetical protein
VLQPKNKLLAASRVLPRFSYLPRSSIETCIFHASHSGAVLKGLLDLKGETVVYEWI